MIIHCNAVLGSDGYAYDPGPFGLIKVPQVGIVKIEHSEVLQMLHLLGRCLLQVVVIEQLSFQMIT